MSLIPVQPVQEGLAEQAAWEALEVWVVTVSDGLMKISDAVVMAEQGGVEVLADWEAMALPVRV